MYDSRVSEDRRSQGLVVTGESRIQEQNVSEKSRYRVERPGVVGCRGGGTGKSETQGQVVTVAGCRDRERLGTGGWD